MRHAVLLLLLVACASKPSTTPTSTAQSAPSASASVVPSSRPLPAGAPERPPEPPPIADEPAPAKPVHVILRVEHVNLAIGAMVFELDDDGNAVYFDGRKRDRGMRGTVSNASLDRLRQVTKKFCSTKTPDNEPMTFVRIEVSLDDVQCHFTMSEPDWKRRAPELMKTIASLEQETCRGKCPTPAPPDDPLVD